MFKQSIKIAIRNILGNKLATIINILGISLSFACCTLIILFIRYELSYDRYHTNSDRIYRFTFGIENETGYKAHFARCAAPWIKYLPEEFPEVEKMALLYPYRHITLKVKEEKISLQTAFYTDSALFEVFDIKLLKGDQKNVFLHSNSVIISASFADKYFNKADPVGQNIINTGWHDGKEWTKLYYTITGVYKDIPANSHFHSDLFISKNTMTWNIDNDWKYVYLLLNRGSGPSDFLNKFHDFLKKHDEDKKFIKNVKPELQNISDIHLNSDKNREIEENSNMRVIYIMGIICFIIIIVSWINYINLNIAGLINRKKSMAIYKINGGSNKTIFGIFLNESFIIILLAICFAVLLLAVFFNLLQNATGNSLKENMFHLKSGIFPWLLVILTGSIIIGCTPAFFYIHNLKKSVSKNVQNHSGKNSNSFFRNILIIFQFSLTIILIISSLTINLQNKFILNHQTGSKQDSVMVIDLFNQDILSKYTLLKSEFLKSPYITEVSAGFGNLYDQSMDAMGFETKGIDEENKNKILWVYAADDNFFDFLEVPIVAGKNFPPFNENLKKEYYILNESAVKELGWKPEEAIGKPFKLKFLYGENVIFGGEIVGVVKNFHLNTLHDEIRPFVFFQKKIWFWGFLVKIDMDHKQQAISYLKDKWNEIAPDYPFEYEFNTDIYFQAYRKEFIQSRLTAIFSILAIILSCLGLFAISSIVIFQRTKEIGIRKVNGARIHEVILMLNNVFVRLIVFAFIIACPIAWFAMKKWLENFAYKTEISWWIFAIAGAMAMIIALLTVSFQSYKAAIRNPVESLKYE